MELLSKSVLDESNAMREAVEERSSIRVSPGGATSFVYNAHSPNSSFKNSSEQTSSASSSSSSSSTTPPHQQWIFRMSLWKNHDDAMLLASQFTLVHHALLLQTPPWEFSAQCGKSKFSKKNRKHIKLSAREFNRTVNMFKLSILMETTAQQRGRALKGLLELAKCALKLHNYHLLKEIHTSLKGPEITRLTQTWSRLDSTRLDTWNELDSLCDPGNAKQFRLQQELKSERSRTTRVPCVPFLPPLLGALERLKVHASMQHEGDDEEQQRLMAVITKTNDVLHKYIFCWSDPPTYEISPHVGIQTVFETFLGMSTRDGFMCDDHHSMLTRLMCLHSRQLEDHANPSGGGRSRSRSTGSLSSSDDRSGSSSRPSLAMSTVIELLKNIGDVREMSAVESGCIAIACYVETVLAKLIGGSGTDSTGTHFPSSSMAGGSVVELQKQMETYQHRIEQVMTCTSSFCSGTSKLSELIRIVYSTTETMVQFFLARDNSIFECLLPSRLRENSSNSSSSSSSKRRTSSISRFSSSTLRGSSMSRTSPRSIEKSPLHHVINTDATHPIADEDQDGSEILKESSNGGNDFVDVHLVLHTVVSHVVAAYVNIRMQECLRAEMIFERASSVLNNSNNGDAMAATLGWSPVGRSDVEEASLLEGAGGECQTLALRRRLKRALIRNVPKNMIGVYSKAFQIEHM